MSDEVLNIGMLDLSTVSNDCEAKSSARTTPRSRSDQVRPAKGTTAHVTKRVNVRKTTTDKTISHATPKKRSLTMTDIRNKMPDNNRTPRKQMKQDSCSTAGHSPRVSDEYPAAESMLTIRRRELQIRTFSKIFYSLWRKQRNIAENFRDEVSQLQLQKSFLMNLRDKESERREEITKVAEKQKTELIELTEELSQLTKERATLQSVCEELQQEYDGSLKYIEKSSVDFDNVHEENLQIILKVKEINDFMDARYIGLKQTLHVVEEVDNRAQQNLQIFEDIHQQRADAFKIIERLAETNKILQETFKTKEENETNLKETIKELRNSLENASIKNVELKSQIKDMELQLECAEHQMNERCFRPYSWGAWSDIVRKAARLSSFILFQVGLFPTF